MPPSGVESLSDHKYESCWPAILQGLTLPTSGSSGGAGASTASSSQDESKVNGVILVYDPDRPNHEGEIGLWYDHFVRIPGISDDRCIIFVHTKDPR
eukprot:9511776-Ditylum_brightwellii.AAC.1